MLQNGKIPTFFGEDIIKELFDNAIPVSAALVNFKKGLAELGISEVCVILYTQRF